MHHHPAPSASTLAVGATMRQMGLAFSPQTTVALAVLSYSFCSGSLVLVNKLILHHLPYPSLVITVQLWATLLFIQVAEAFNFIE